MIDMKRTLLLLALVVATVAQGQTDWKEIGRLIENGSYTTAYNRAEAVYRAGRATSRQRLTAAVYMAQAAAYYQEDAADSSEARFRSLLREGSLNGVDRALCHAFLGNYDSALVDEALLKRTAVEQVKEFCHSSKAPNMTPTVYDLLVVQLQDRGTTTPQQRASWQRRLCAFHASDADDRVLLWHTVRLLDMLDNIPNHPLSLDTIQHYIDLHRNTRCDLLAELYLRAAQHVNAEGDHLAAIRYCDSATARFPKSNGGINCANLKGSLLNKNIDLQSDLLNVIPGKASLQLIRYQNMEHVWFRLVAWDDETSLHGDKTRQRLSAAHPIEQWDLALPPDDSLNMRTASFAMPALKAGRYILLASPGSDFKAGGFVASEVVCTDMLMAYLGQGHGILMDRSSGLPIVGQEVRLEYSRYNKPTKVLATAITDSDGRFGFTKPEGYWNTRLVAERDGVEVVTEIYWSGVAVPDSSVRCEVRTDRPIYRPGDTLHVATMAYRSDGHNGTVVDACPLRLTLIDPNGEKVASDSLPTDAYGLASTSFTIPTDRLPGVYRLLVHTGDRMLGSATARVEAYKQPRFMVSLDASGQQEAPAFGRQYTVRGVAASYSAVPVSEARVQYSVRRQRLSRWWWRWFGVEDDAVIVEGETTTDADGGFSLSFIPLPDSSIDLTGKPTFQYVVSVDVTDINGESHEEKCYLRVGYRNATLDLTDDWQPIYRDLNGNELPGTPKVVVERLVPPAINLLTPPIYSQESEAIYNTVDTSEWHRLFPWMARERGYNDPLTWRGQPCGYTSPKQCPSGTYRITVSAPDADTLVVCRTITNEGEHYVQARENLLWADINTTTAEVGQRVHLRFGSPLDGTQIYYMLRVGNDVRDFRRIAADNGLIQNVYIDVDSTMLGGLQVDLITVRHGVQQSWSRTVNVPYTHKQLAVEVSTFRDKLLPGQQEEWAIKVKDSKGNGTESALLMTLYDDALNSYGSPSAWGFWPWHFNSVMPIRYIGRYLGGADFLDTYKYKYYSGTNPSAWSLAEAIPHRARWGGIRMYKTAAARNAMVTTSLAVVEEEEAVADDMVEDATVQVAMGAAKSSLQNGIEAVALLDEAKSMHDAGAQPTTEPQLRSNLSSLAFFAADVRTDTNGDATYRFTVPELLTRWNLRGLAVSRDLKIGTLDKSLITSKPLMVQPNMPRFLRHGDSIVLMAKVMNTTEAAREVEVSLTLTDALTGSPVAVQHRCLDVAGQGSGQVEFAVKVPTSVHVLTYQIVASTSDGHAEPDLPTLSDGERGQVPVLSNRQVVTVSRAVYINGAGEKHFAMPEWLESTASREPQFVVAELVSNPMWLALKSMPFLASLESPSTIYLANLLYVNRLGSQMLRQAGVHDWLALEGGIDSRLAMNAEVKQTPLQATPWQAAAESEAAQRRAVASYFDSASLSRQYAETLQQLTKRQNADGGWSWMPDGESSVWITQQVLKRVVGERNNLGTTAALSYVDNEVQRHYAQYIKPYLKRYTWRPLNIDYLFMHSLYGKANTEAYRFYYANALKEYANYNNLYTQAQLALIFHRHGDRREARDLLRRIKEKALVSDEMGMYWRDNTGSYWWYQRPIETQALIIQAFAEISPDDSVSIGLMQQWLLKQKQTTHWGSDLATTEAIRSLMVGQHSAPTRKAVSMTVFGTPLEADSQGPEGYQRKRWDGAALDSLRARASSDITVAGSGRGIAWGAVMYQFATTADQLTSYSSGMTISRSVKRDTTLEVGDRLTVSIDFSCDRAMDYVEIVDGRPSCVEPVSTQAGWRFGDGLRYYVAVNNTDTRYYIEHLEKGKYHIEYDVYVTNRGHFEAAPIAIQCMYAPEFRSLTGGENMAVGD